MPIISIWLNKVKSYTLFDVFYLWQVEGASYLQTSLNYIRMPYGFNIPTPPQSFFLDTPLS
jgi:hypothetical protein